MKDNIHIEKKNEFMLYKFIKLGYYNTDNMIQKMMKFIIKFNEKISKSQTIIESLYKLYPDFKTLNLFESGFINNIFKTALKNSFFFPFDFKKQSIPLTNSGTMLFFIPNRTKFDEKNLALRININQYLIGNLSVFIYNEFHGILGLFLKIILKNKKIYILKPYFSFIND